MCYTIQQLEERIRKQGLRNQNTPDEIEKALQLFRKQMSGEPLFVVSGFDHPELLCIYRDEALVLEKMSWGLIPSWSKDIAEAMHMRNMTLNARSESLFEKKSFKEAAKRNRCLLPVTGFFEYKHFKGKKYPYFIDWADEELRLLGCVYEEWQNPITNMMDKTFAIVTTKGNSMMSVIHNNPQLDEPRMPLILDGNNLLKWLDPDTDEEEIKSLFAPSTDADMRAHTVRPLRGKYSPGNTALASEVFNYPELIEPLTLF